MRHNFQAMQWVPYPIEKVFAFFANPENLPRLMPSWQKARIESAKFITPPNSAEHDCRSPAAGKGSTMMISFLPFPFSPFRLTWEALIVEFEWNIHFCDEQPRGPFVYWRHCHRVSEEDRSGVSGTLITDDLVYEIPLGIFAEPAHFFFVRKQIEGIFAYRQKRLMELLAR
jgi:ligand-binding SRPBCC domain-containing protein